MTDKYPNHTTRSLLENLVSFKKGHQKIGHKDADVMFLRHDEFPNKELYCVPQWTKVVEEDVAKHFFDNTPSTNNQGDGGQNQGEEEGKPVPDEVTRAGNVVEDIALVCVMGFMVEDNNDPVPENVPQEAEAPTPTAFYDDQTWGWGSADQQSLFGAQNHWPKLNGLSGLALELVTATTMFLLFFLSNLLRECYFGRDKQKPYNKAVI